MKIDLIKKDGEKLILLFLGYSFMADCIKHLEVGDYSLAVIYDYSELSFDDSFLKDKDIYLVSWSMGVWAANLVLKNIPLKKSIAINGTPFGIDDKYGINAGNFYKTITNYNFESFKKLCFLGIPPEKISNFEFNKNAKLELINLYKNAIKPCDNNICWDKAIISKKDLIFPPKASEYFSCQKIYINAPHFAFFNFKGFGDIVEI
ncbi:hypothetical protein CFT12S00416_04780 [Campylobacter fetus subsp. testudinum]|uniref:pimeloyl-ACP methyl esterase BioG family protein n=1 Tax=Campylobacter fetus TaxID=196 RepID=UPI000818A9B9|nr:pimeloyl-ACP methyl esterase BioG family protein [Campylobacter fetus]OCR89112.1 hypothetical protein CFT12S00416_04780 [Campylobacter fetus subsp. testudinum]OCS00114.1 hypothetical protein A9K75_04905 [Campylobacter fetus subsp. testudinum]